MKALAVQQACQPELGTRSQPRNNHSSHTRSPHPHPQYTRELQTHTSRARLGRAALLHHTDHVHNGISSASVTFHKMKPCYRHRQNGEQKTCPTLLNVKGGLPCHSRWQLRPQTQVWGPFAAPTCCSQPQAVRFHHWSKTTGPVPPAKHTEYF